MTERLARIDIQRLVRTDSEGQAEVLRLGTALREEGFFALVGHGLTADAIAEAYEAAERFFAAPEAEKLRYEDVARGGQRGYTRMGRERAKDSDVPDLKEFWQIGRTDVPDDHPVHQVFGGNVWPTEVPRFQGAMTHLYETLEGLGMEVLRAAARYLGEPADRFASAAHHGDTILRVIHYPPVGERVPSGAVRAAAHEDINFLTLLIGATAEGLELLEKDGTFRPVRGEADEIIVDSGDMLQNLTNGVFRSLTHRVVIPDGPSRQRSRYSMPCFVHPRHDVDLTPLASCVERVGEAKFPSITAGAYLRKRLQEIGLY